MPPKTRFCAICGTHAEFSCASCHSASYCSEACQRKDWALHRLLCKEYSAWLDLRPYDTKFSTYKLGLLFPKDSKYPKFTWVECELQTDDMRHQEINIPSRELPGDIECFRKRWGDHSIELWMEQKRPSPRSQLLARNVILFEGKDENPYVVRYGTTWVKAAKINSDGDMFTRGAERYTQVEIQRDYSIFDHNSEVCQISKLMGIPLRVQKCGIDISWKDATFNPFFNRMVEPMMLPADSDTWYLKESSPWLEDVAQIVLVARQDKMDLTAQQLEVFARYCEELVAPAMLGPNRLGDHLDGEGREGVVKRYMCRELFDVFLLEVKLSAHAKGFTGWDEVISPYISPCVVWESKVKPTEGDVKYSVAPAELYFDIERPTEIELDYG